MLIRKTYINKVIPYVGLDIVKVITGIRRCGKSVLLKQIQEEIKNNIDKDGCFFYLNLEEEDNSKYLKKGVFHKFILNMMNNIKNKKLYLFLDEIHDMEDWELTVNSLRAKNIDIYITGSNSRLLSGELATCLTGRYVEIMLTPFSFAEFMELLDYKTISKEVAFQKYLKLGGMPFISNINYNEELTYNYLNDVFSSIIFKDVASRGNIRDIDLLNRIIRYVMTECGHSFSATSIAKFLKNEKRQCSVDTILNYLNLCEQAFIFSRVKRHDLIGKKVLSVDDKFYVADHGIRRALIGGSFANDIDQILENIVYFELVRRGFRVTVGKISTKEIDFVAEKGEEKLYYQVTYLMSEMQTRKREFDALLAISDNYSKYIISLDTIDMSSDGIKHINLLDFLLEG